MASRTRFGSAKTGRAVKGAPRHLLVSKPRFMRFYKMISKLFVTNFNFFFILEHAFHLHIKDDMTLTRILLVLIG